MDGIELVSFKIISAVGTARSSYIEAIQEAKKGNIDAALDLMNEGKQMFIEGHRAHAELVQQEAAGNKVEFSMLLMHAEDQLMSAETLKIVAEEFIELYKKMN